MRLALGVLSLAALPLFVPGFVRFVWALVAYLFCAFCFRVAIKKDFGGVARVLLGGAIDVGFITFLVHRLGSQSTPLVSVYVLAGMFHAFVTPAWSARLVGALGVLSYAAIVYAEALGWLPYSPDLPDFIGVRPSFMSATRAALLVAGLITVSTWVSERIALALRRREQQLRDANSRLETLSQRDPLTQLYNRRYFVKRTEEELARVRRGHPMAVLMMDLDGFKHINDQQGHLAGDELLKRIALSIEATVREIDVVGRFGGDEFVVLLTNTDAAQAVVVAERLVRTVRAVGTEADPFRPVTASIGIGIAHADDDVGVVLSAADDAAYLAKQQGGDRIRSPLVTAVSGFISGEPASGSGELSGTG